MKKIISILIITIFLTSSTSIIAGRNEVKNENIKSLNYENIGELIQQLDEEMMLGYIEDLVDISNKYRVTFPYNARLTGTIGCEEGAEYIYNKFSEMGLDVRYIDWDACGTFGLWQGLRFISQNVEAVLPGTSGSEAAYVICAHYDTVMDTPSADDNSAGVAAVLSAAKILSQYEFNYDIRFICWSGEEQGLIGSNAYVEESYWNCDNIIAAINLDMIGYSSEEIEGDEYKVRIYETCSNNLISSAIKVSQNPDCSPYINFEVVPSEDDSGHGSDQKSFCKFAYSSIFIHEYTWNDEKDRSGDTIENMDVNYATRLARLAMGTLVQLVSTPVFPNNPPIKPEAPNGPDNAKINVPQTYTATTDDPDGDLIYYLFDWDDGTNSGWVGPYNPGEIAHASHTWTEENNYKIKVKAKDINGIQSEWSESPKNGKFSNSHIMNLFVKFPIFFRIIKYILYV